MTEIEEPYEGSLSERIHDFNARITECAPHSPEHFVRLVAWLLWEFAEQHADDPKKLWHEATTV